MVYLLSEQSWAEQMALFPFAHTIEMTHRLKDGVPEVAVRPNNLSAEPMPKDLQYVAPGESREESFWIKTTGF